MARGMHVCSFSNGFYTVRSPSGKHGLLFEDSNQFGPSKLNPRTAEISPISDRLLWFWRAYPAWREAGRPVTSKPQTSPIGDIHHAHFEPFY